MPIFIASLLGGLVSAAGTLVGRVLLSLGIGYVTYTGVDASIAFAKSFLVAGVGALPANAIAVAGAMKLGVCISILTSALVARMTLAGLTSGAVTRMVTKAP